MSGLPMMTVYPVGEKVELMRPPELWIPATVDRYTDTALFLRYDDPECPGWVAEKFLKFSEVLEKLRRCGDTLPPQVLLPPEPSPAPALAPAPQAPIPIPQASVSEAAQTPPEVTGPSTAAVADSISSLAPSVAAAATPPIPFTPDPCPTTKASAKSATVPFARSTKSESPHSVRGKVRSLLHRMGHAMKPSHEPCRD